MNAVAIFNPSQIRLRAFASEQVSVGASVTTLDATKANNSFRAYFKVDGGGAARYTTDGSTPSATYGVPIFDGEQLELSHDDAVAFKAFRVGGTNAVLNVEYLAPNIV